MKDSITVQIMNKALLLRIDKELLQINQQTNNSTKKIAKDMNKYFTAEEIWMGNKPKEKVLNLIVIRKMQMDTAWDFSERE